MHKRVQNRRIKRGCEAPEVYGMDGMTTKSDGVEISQK